MNAKTATRPPPKPARLAWRHRPGGWILILASAVLLCVAPAWLMADMLDYYRLHGDDFVYLAGSRSWAVLANHLWEPHNAHVVPLFRLGTYALVRAAGRLA